MMPNGGQWRYKTFKKEIRVASQVVGYVACGAFFIAPATSFNGFLWMAGALFVGVICIFAYHWTEPDVDPEESKQ